MKSSIFLVLLILLNFTIVAKDKLSTTKKTEPGKAGIEGKFNVKSGQMDLANIGSFYYEGFDEYTPGDYLAVVDENWSTWSNDPGGPEDGLITDEHAFSESNSVKVDGNTDLILPLGDKTSGIYMLNFSVYIPSENVGYFNISHFDTPDIDFALHCYFNQEGGGIFTASGNNISFQYNNDEWVNVNLIVDLDNDLAFFSVNETVINSWMWSDLAEGGNGTKQLGSIDFYASNSYGSPLMYFDDVMLIKMEKQQVALNIGWNIISFRVLPGNRNLKDILQPLIDSGRLVKVQDERGYSLEKILGSWKNDIGDIALTEGFKVKVNANDLIEIYGPTVDFPYAIPLKTGWNIIGYPQIKTFDGLDLVQELIKSNSLIKVQNEEGYSIEYLSIFNKWTNNIGGFVAGEGYKIKVRRDDTLWINDSYPKSATLQPESVTATHFIPSFKGNGTDHMNIFLVNPSESGIVEGDEIGIFDENICVGSAKINFPLSTFNLQPSTLSIPVSASDGSVGKNGFYDGNPVTLTLFRNGTEYPLYFETLNNGKTTFEKGSSLFAKVFTDKNTDIPETSKTNYFSCFPNPFSEKLNFEFVSDKNARAVIEIFNITGQTVSRLMDQPVQEGVMNRVEYAPANIISGVYFYRLKLDGKASVGKVMYRK